jgi:hypothetical protein
VAVEANEVRKIPKEGFGEYIWTNSLHITSLNMSTFFFRKYENINVLNRIIACISIVNEPPLWSSGPEVPGSIPGATRFSEKYWFRNGVHSAS